VKVGDIGASRAPRFTHGCNCECDGCGNCEPAALLRQLESCGAIRLIDCGDEPVEFEEIPRDLAWLPWVACGVFWAVVVFAAAWAELI